MNDVRASFYDFTQSVHHYEELDCELMTESCNDFDSSSVCQSFVSLLTFLLKVVSVKYASCSTLSTVCPYFCSLVAFAKTCPSRV